MAKSYDKLFIGGEWATPDSGEKIEVISPYTEDVIATVPAANETDIDRAVRAARAAFDEGPWPRTPPEERADMLAKLSAEMVARLEEVAEVITAEMGCAMSFSGPGQALASVMVLDKYAEMARGYTWEDRRAGIMGDCIVRREPVGVCGLIVPWNFPLSIITFKLGAALAAGCTAVVKPAPESPLDALMLAEMVEAAGFPPGVVNVVPAQRDVSESLVRHPSIDKIGFTGNTEVGRRIGAICGEQLKRCTLELGGKSAAIVLEDADPATIAVDLVGAGLVNAGQACGAQTRVLLPRSRYEDHVNAMAECMGAMKVGDPMDPETQIGPLVSQRQRDRVLGYIEAGKSEGARVAVGGGRPAACPKGWFVEPTLLADVDNSMKVAQEEIFGPVLVAIPYDDEDDAVRIANDSPYGLSGSVWTPNIQHGLEIAARVRTGTFNLNGFTVEFGAPFGGVKCSGYGRELGPEGITSYVEHKAINVFG